MWNQKEYWLKFAKEAQKDVLSKDLNDSWDASSQSYKNVTIIEPEHLKIVSENTKMENVLDFGCGMGRNLDYLGTVFKNVYGFDTEPMTYNLKNHKPNVKNLHSDISDLSSVDFDVVYEATVFQHMPPSEVWAYLSALKTKYLVSWTRSYNDFQRNFGNNTGGINMMELIHSLDKFELVDCTIDTATAAGLMNETHYKVLYKLK